MVSDRQEQDGETDVVCNIDIQLQTVVAAVFSEFEQGVYCCFSFRSATL